jgi:two-component system alkaline phosphatase synthesis response regulator PhoP
MATTKILVVDDETDIVRMVSLRLQSVGYEVIIASDGEAATQIAIHELPDLVILDIGIPCVDGHVVAQRLANHPDTLSIPILFLTARTSEVDKKRAAAVRSVGYLVKPFQSQQLLDAVSAALRHGAMRKGDCYALQSAG